MSGQSPLVAVRAALDTDRAGLRAAVERVPVSHRQEKPADGRWSVAEVLEHLAIVEARTVAALTPMVADCPVVGAAATATPLDRTLLRDRTTRVAAPDLIQPTGTLDAQQAWAALETSRRDLLTLLAAAEGRDLTTIGRTHPRLGQIDGYQWISSIGGHEERHTLQILEIAADLRARTEP